jgi:hypothetical protein
LPSDSCAKQAGPTSPPQPITTGHALSTRQPCSDSQPENASPLPDGSPRNCCETLIAVMREAASRSVRALRAISWSGRVAIHLCDTPWSALRSPQSTHADRHGRVDERRAGAAEGVGASAWRPAWWSGGEQTPGWAEVQSLIQSSDVGGLTQATPIVVAWSAAQCICRPGCRPACPSRESGLGRAACSVHHTRHGGPGLAENARWTVGGRECPGTEHATSHARAFRAAAGRLPAACCPPPAVPAPAFPFASWGRTMG